MATMLSSTTKTRSVWNESLNVKYIYVSLQGVTTSSLSASLPRLKKPNHLALSYVMWETLSETYSRKTFYCNDANHCDLTVDHLFTHRCSDLASNAMKQTWISRIVRFWQWWWKWCPLCRAPRHWLWPTVLSSPTRGLKSACSHTNNVSSSPTEAYFCQQGGQAQSATCDWNRPVTELFRAPGIAEAFIL